MNVQMTFALLYRIFELLAWHIDIGQKKWNVVVAYQATVVKASPFLVPVGSFISVLAVVNHLVWDMGFSMFGR